MRVITIWLLVASCLAACGCTFRNSQLTACQAEKEQLLTTIRTQRDTTRTLQTLVASLESRLDQAEKQLALGNSPTRLSRVPARTSETKSSPSLSAPAPSPVRSDGLPWRSPGAKKEATVPAIDSRRGDSRSGSSTSLVSLARRDRRIEYDSEKSVARVNMPISFDEKSATITAEGKRQLDEVARLLKSDDARETRVMVAGFSAGRASGGSANDGDGQFGSARQLGTARAQAVADYLDRHGIAQERLEVTGAGNGGGDSASGVDVFLLEPDASAVAWWPGGDTVRR
jgi:outer membrane protein OmpA-like peptidoglycan-associated protein